MMGSLRPAEHRAYLAAVDPFPNHAAAIRRLMKRDATFRAICEELYETEAALEGHPLSREADSQERRDDLLERVGRLVGKILAALLSQQAREFREH